MEGGGGAVLHFIHFGTSFLTTRFTFCPSAGLIYTTNKCSSILCMNCFHIHVRNRKYPAIVEWSITPPP